MKEIRKKEEKYLATLKDENTDENLTGVEKKANMRQTVIHDGKIASQMGKQFRVCQKIYCDAW